MVRLNRTRGGVTLLAVILLHAGLVSVVAIALRNRHSDLRAPELVTTLLVLDLPPPTAQLGPSCRDSRPSPR